MKPTVPETGTVISATSGEAVVLLSGGPACKGCGAAKMGLCRPAGNSMIVHVSNTAAAKEGERVLLGLDPGVRRKGLFLAYLLPLISFLAGSLAGHVLAGFFRFPPADAIFGFAALLGASAFSLRRLRNLDRTSRMEIKRVIREFRFTSEIMTDEERRFENYAR